MYNYTKCIFLQITDFGRNRIHGIKQTTKRNTFEK